MLCGLAVNRITFKGIGCTDLIRVAAWVVLPLAPERELYSVLVCTDLGPERKLSAKTLEDEAAKQETEELFALADNVAAQEAVDGLRTGIKIVYDTMTKFGLKVNMSKGKTEAIL